jgi:hypothetical protein
MRKLFCSVLLLLAALPLQASHEAGASIWWCPGFNGSVDFHVELAYFNFDQHPVGYKTLETFDFGDGTSGLIEMTAVQLFPGQAHGWYLAEGAISHTYAPGSGVVKAGLDTCCRPGGSFGSLDLNNRRLGPLRVAAEVNTDLLFGACPNSILAPPLFWLQGKLGDTLEFYLAPHDHDPFQCCFATDAEAGGGPNPDGMTIDPDTCRVTWTPAGDPNKLWTAQVQAQRENYGSAAFDFVVGIDGAPPLCVIDHIEYSQPVRLHILVRDTLSGIGGISVVQADNASVSIPPFQRGDGAPLDVVATKIRSGQSSQVQLRVVDAVGNALNCDPILTDEGHTYLGVPSSERIVTVTNGDPGLQRLDVDVNGRLFRLTGLSPGEERTLDVASAVAQGVDSTFTLTAYGQPGGSAAVLIWDGGAPR